MLRKKMKLAQEQKHLIEEISKELEIDKSEILFLLIEFGQMLMIVTEPTEKEKEDRLDQICENYKDLPAYKNYKEIARVFRECFEAGKDENQSNNN